MMTIDTTNMCSHLQRKLFDEDGIYHLAQAWQWYSCAWDSTTKLIVTGPYAYVRNPMK